MVGKGEGATSSAAVRGIRSLFAACYNCCCFSSCSLFLLLPLFLQLQQNLIASRCTGHAYKWAAPATATEKCLPHSQKLIKLKVNAHRAP